MPVNFMKRVSSEKTLWRDCLTNRRKIEKRLARLMTGPPLVQSEAELEIGYKSESARSRSGSDSSPNDDLDLPIQTGRKFIIDEEVAKRRPLEDKARTDVKAKGPATLGTKKKRQG